MYSPTSVAHSDRSSSPSPHGATAVSHPTNAAWSSSSPKPASKPNRSWSTEHPADASTDPTSSSVQGRLQAWWLAACAALLIAIPTISRALPDALLSGIRNAGAIFVGRHTPEVIGDYVGGSNHVLPTARSARFSSGLSVLDYVKRTSILRLGPDQLRALGPAAIALANAEGLDAHARSVAIRLNFEGDA